MLAIVPVIVLAGGLSVGAFDDTLIQDTVSVDEPTTIVLSAAEIQDNKDRDMYFD